MMKAPPLTLAKIAFRDFRHKWKPLELPRRSFKGQVVCVTGATAGLGLAAAIHFVNLGADEVIITYRDDARGNAAKQHILKWTTSMSVKIRLMELDMDRYASVVAFANELKRVRAGRGGIDYVLLNAGVNQGAYVESSEGWPEDIQVNTLSTVLLALLLLPWIMDERKNRQTPAHLGFVSSGMHFIVDQPSTWSAWAESEGAIAHWKQKSNWPVSFHRGYGMSKLFLMYDVAEIAKLAYGGEEQPKVIVNTMCPGGVQTEIARHMNKRNPVHALIMKPFGGLMTKKADNGARILVVSGLTKEYEHGRFKARYISEEEYQKLWAPFGHDEVGKRMLAKVWTETIDILTAAVPELKQVLEQLQMPPESKGEKTGAVAGQH